jgi:hypothetical protein
MAKDLDACGDERANILTDWAFIVDLDVSLDSHLKAVAAYREIRNRLRSSQNANFVAKPVTAAAGEGPLVDPRSKQEFESFARRHNVRAIDWRGAARERRSRTVGEGIPPSEPMDGVELSAATGGQPVTAVARTP